MTATYTATYDEASLREYGDGQHLIAYVEINYSAYDSLKRSKSVNWTSDYRFKGKLIAKDFAFEFQNSSDKRDIKKRLEKLLKTKLEKY